MGMFFVYIIKVALLQTVFYLTYKLLLSRESFHAFNRGVLLAMQAAALLLPLLHVTLETPAPVHQTIALAEAAFVQTAAGTEGDGSGLTLVQALTLVWMGGFALLLSRSVVSLVRLVMLLRSGRRCEVAGAVVTVVGGDRAPFSWFRRIVISEKDRAAGAREIVIHEQAHVSRLHSLDIALCNTIIMFCWFSPAAWLLRAELRDVHEYEADDAVLRRGVDASGYQLLLIRKAVGERLFAMANNLNQTNLKKRITMMKMRKSNPWNRAKAVAVLPLAAVSVLVFATPAATKMAGVVAQESSKVVSEAGAMVVKAGTTRENETSLTEAVFGKKSVSDRVRAESNDSVRSLISGFSKPVPDDVLVCINGRLTNTEELSKIDISKIESMTVFDGKNASVIYGDKGKSGAIIVTLKKPGEASSSSSVTSENPETAGKVNALTIDMKGKPEAAGRTVGVRSVKLNSGDTEHMKVDVYRIKEEPVYKIDDEIVTKEDVEALSTDQIKSVVVDKDGILGKGTVNVYLKKDSSNE